jgi:hypothetical protein
MIPRPAYYSILDVSFGWHGIAVPNKVRSALPPVARVTLAMLLHAIVDARLAVYEPSTGAATDAAKLRNASVVMDEVEGTPTALAQMSASGAYDAKVLAHYRLCMDELFVWAIGEDLDPPTCCVPSWSCVIRPATTAQARKMRPELYDKSVCQTIAKRRWAEDDRIAVVAMARDREIQIQGNGRLYRETTVRKWLDEVAPPTVSEKSGRALRNRSPEYPIGKAIADSAHAARRFDGRTMGGAPMPAVVGAGMSAQDR